MKIVFQPAFAVEIRHDYYPDGISDDFRVAPTPACQQRLLALGLLFKPTPEGFIVLYETTGGPGPPEPKRPLAAPLSLAFGLWSRQPFLVNYSQLPLERDPDQFFYLSNRQKSLQDGQRLLTADPAVEFLSSADLARLRPQRFQVAAETPQGTVLWEVFDALGNAVLRRRVAVVEGRATWLVDLSARPPGAYRLLRDGAEELRFYADDRLAGGVPFGLIEIAVDPQVSEDFRFVAADGQVQFRRYRLNLQARKTTWEYRVVARYETEVKPTDLTVSLDDPPVTFSRQPAVTLADGRAAIPFVAGTPLPLSKQPLKGIVLSKKKGPSTPKLDIANLPNPSVAEVIPAGGDQVISRVYIYV